jgi:hypothetical protein
MGILTSIARSFVSIASRTGLCMINPPSGFLGTDSINTFSNKMVGLGVICALNGLVSEAIKIGARLLDSFFDYLDSLSVPAKTETVVTVVETVEVVVTNEINEFTLHGSINSSLIE